VDRHVIPLQGLYTLSLFLQKSWQGLAKILLYRSCSGCHYFCKIAGNLLRKSTGLSHLCFLTREDDDHRPSLPACPACAGMADRRVAREKRTLGASQEVASCSDVRKNSDNLNSSCKEAIHVVTVLDCHVSHHSFIANCSCDNP